MYQKQQQTGPVFSGVWFRYKEEPSVLSMFCYAFCCQLHSVTMATAREWLLAMAIISALYRESDLREVIDANRPNNQY